MLWKRYVLPPLHYVSTAHHHYDRRTKKDFNKVYIVVVEVDQCPQEEQHPEGARIPEHLLGSLNKVLCRDEGTNGTDRQTGTKWTEFSLLLWDREWNFNSQTSSAQSTSSVNRENKTYELNFSISKTAPSPKYCKGAFLSWPPHQGKIFCGMDTTIKKYVKILLKIFSSFFHSLTICQ